MENNKNVKEIPILEIGKFFDIDPDGYLINPASKEKIQKEWIPIVNDIIEKYKFYYGESLHSVYIRGSVGKGDAIPGISDVDTFAYVTSRITETKTDWMKSFEKESEIKYPFAKGIELSVSPVENSTNNKIFIIQSACVYGPDLNKVIGKIKPGKDTMTHTHSFSRNLKLFDWMHKPETPEEIKKYCTILMKKILRVGLELTIERSGKYTRDLYPSYKIFSEYYPEREKEMKEVLYLAINPTEDLSILTRIRKNLGSWIVEKIEENKR